MNLFVVGAGLADLWSLNNALNFLVNATIGCLRDNDYNNEGPKTGNAEQEGEVVFQVVIRICNNSIRYGPIAEQKHDIAGYFVEFADFFGAFFLTPRRITLVHFHVYRGCSA